MASRMDRYNNSQGRSEKNKSLYDEINELDSYNNIEAISEIPNSNEISMETIKELIKSNEKKVMEYKKEVANKQPQPKVEEKDKNYDIRDILDKAKIDHTSDDQRYRRLNNTQYDVLKDIKIEEIDDTDELKAIIDTLSLGSQNSDDLGLLDELKSNTMVGDASSIKKIINEAKEAEEKDNVVKEEKKEELTSHLTNVDTSFFSSSFSFSDKDFEDLKDIESNTKDHSKLINILIAVFSILIALAILFLIVKFVLKI